MLRRSLTLDPHLSGSDTPGGTLTGQLDNTEPIGWTHDPEKLHIPASTPDAYLHAYLYRYSVSGGWEYLRGATIRLRFWDGNDSPADLVPGRIVEVASASKPSSTSSTPRTRWVYT